MKFSIARALIEAIILAKQEELIRYPPELEGSMADLIKAQGSKDWSRNVVTAKMKRACVPAPGGRCV